jgi:hypothetical protein
MLSRRQFLKLSALGLLGAGFSPLPPAQDHFTPPTGLIGRIASDENTVPIYEKPTKESDVVRETAFDELLPLYYEVRVEADEENPNPLWYRVWGGYLHSAYVQPTRYQLNPFTDIPECGQLAEVTVPYTQAYKRGDQGGWEKDYRLYYSTTHWITGIETGPDGNPWYLLTSELTEHLSYYVKPQHLRPVPDREFIPTAIHVPDHEKRVEVSLWKQTLTAFEYDEPVFQTRISSGLGAQEVPKGNKTPIGRFHITSKSPSKHMGGVNATGAPGDFVLPGVPWTTFFIYETGVAFHGAYWHNNFGSPMSHGCINMRPPDAKWLFNWVTPAYDPPYRGHCSWDVRGRGTRIDIY